MGKKSEIKKTSFFSKELTFKAKMVKFWSFLKKKTNSVDFENEKHSDVKKNEKQNILPRFYLFAVLTQRNWVKDQSTIMIFLQVHRC